jgi:fructosamine-3-kinase
VWPAVIVAIEEHISRGLRRPWRVGRVTDLGDRASHPCALLHGEDGVDVFAKVDDEPRLAAELRGLGELRAAGAAAAQPAGDGLVRTGHGAVLVTEGLVERPPAERTRDDWRAIGTALARLHQVRGETFGSTTDGWFGPLPQHNRPVPGGTWAEFHRERRLAPYLRAAVDAGHLPADVAAGVEGVIDCVAELGGPEPTPTLLHGDAQHHNIVSTSGGAVFVDPAPYYGHPEVDLAMLDLFSPVPADVVDAYRAVTPLADGFTDRRELWRLPAYLAIVAVTGDTAFGRGFLARVAAAVAPFSRRG